MAETVSSPPSTSSNNSPYYLRILANRLLSFLRDVLPILLNAVTFVTLSGYLVIAGYVLNYTKLQIYDIDIKQYILAGISFLFYIGSYPFTIVGIALAMFVGCLIIGLVIALLFIKIDEKAHPLPAPLTVDQAKALFTGSTEQEFNKQLSDYLDKSLGPSLGSLRRAQRLSELIDRADRLWDRLQKPAATLILILEVVLIVFGAPLYGYSGYVNGISLLGGGKPVDIVILFKDSSRGSGWSFPVDATNGRSDKVQLVLKLTDGILVWDEAHRIASVVKDDAIDGIIDLSQTAQRPMSNITPTPSATP